MKKIFLKGLSIKIQNLGLLLFLLVILLFPHQNVKAVSPQSCPLPATIMAVPPTINAGESSTLHWSSTGANTCTGTNFTASSPNGTVLVHPSNTTDYTLQCSIGTDVSVPVHATVTVNQTPPPPSSCNLPLSGGQYTVNNSILNGPGQLNKDVTNCDVTVKNGAVLATSGLNNFQNLTVDNAKVTTTGNSTSPNIDDHNLVDLNVSQTFSLSNGGNVDMNALGYSAGILDHLQGYGQGGAGAAMSSVDGGPAYGGGPGFAYVPIFGFAGSGGGGNGGKGGDGYTAWPKAVQDPWASPTVALNPGGTANTSFISGSGAGYAGISTQNVGNIPGSLPSMPPGHGGGKIHIKADTIKIDALSTISANGSDGYTFDYNTLVSLFYSGIHQPYFAGGGAGGTIWLESTDFNRPAFPGFFPGLGGGEHTPAAGINYDGINLAGQPGTVTVNLNGSQVATQDYEDRLYNFFAVGGQPTYQAGMSGSQYTYAGGGGGGKIIIKTNSFTP